MTQTQEIKQLKKVVKTIDIERTKLYINNIFLIREVQKLRAENEDLKSSKYCIKEK